MIAEFTAALDRAAGIVAADGGALWRVDVSGAGWIGAADGVWHLSRDPGQPEFRPRGRVWTGPAPADLVTANTAVEWGGRSWALVGLPLPADPATALRLLLHEHWHAVVHPALFAGVYAQESGGGLLDRAAGRVWLRLELAALAAALRGSGPEHARAAVAFRRRRYEEADEPERRRETALDITEGLAEYTAWRLAGSEHLADWVATPYQGSWVRSFAYRTGPAYGFLLDEFAVGWRDEVAAHPDLTALLERAVGVGAVDAAAYGYDAIRSEEAERDRHQATHRAHLKARFEDGPLLRIHRGEPGISFDPRRVAVLESGTVRGDVGWRGDEATRFEADQALIAADWSEIRVPLGDAAAPDSGPGWRLHLGPGWVARHDDRGWLVEPRAGAGCGRTSGHRPPPAVRFGTMTSPAKEFRNGADAPPAERILVVTAHPDDLDFGAGGTIAGWTASGIEVAYCIATRGDSGQSGTTPRDKVAEVRTAEAKAAAAALGVSDVTFLGYPDSRVLVTLDLRRDIARQIRRVRPDRVLTLSPVRSWGRIANDHPDHIAVGEATMCAVYPDASNRFIHPELFTEEGLNSWRTSDVWMIAGPGTPTYVDVTDTFDKKLAALRAHDSQTSHMSGLEDRLRETLAENAAKVGLPEGRLAEIFGVFHTGKP